MERFVTTLRDRQGGTHSVLVTRDGSGGWRAQCRLPGQEVIEGVSEKRRDAVATVERKLIRATGGGALIGQYRTCAFTVEASNVVPLRRR